MDSLRVMALQPPATGRKSTFILHRFHQLLNQPEGITQYYRRIWSFKHDTLISIGGSCSAFTIADLFFQSCFSLCQMFFFALVTRQFCPFLPLLLLFHMIHILLPHVPYIII